MAIYVEINNNRYEASITGRLVDKEWNNRDSKAIKLKMNYVDALDLFVDNLQWSIIQDIQVPKNIEDENGNITTEMVMEEEAYDNSEYCIAGDIIDHRDGFVTVKMGRPTAEELLAMLEEVL